MHVRGDCITHEAPYNPLVRRLTRHAKNINESAQARDSQAHRINQDWLR